MRWILLASIGLLLWLMTATPQISPAATASPRVDPAVILEDAADLVLLAVAQTCSLEENVTGFAGGTTVRGRVRCTLWIGTDLGQAEVTAIDHDNRVLTIQLQLPGVLQVAVDHRASQINSQRNGLWAVALNSMHETTLTQQLFAQAQQQVAEQPLDPALLRRARRHARTVLQQLFEAQGWEIKIRWREP